MFLSVETVSFMPTPGEEDKYILSKVSFLLKNLTSDQKLFCFQFIIT